MKKTRFWASGEGSSSVQEIFASTQVQLTSAQVQALKFDVSPQIIVPGVPGKVIVPIDIYFQNTSLSPMETSGAKMICGYAQSNTQFLAFYDQFMNSVRVDVSNVIEPSVAFTNAYKGNYLSDPTGLPLKLWSDLAFNGGFTTKVQVVYFLIENA